MNKVLKKLTDLTKILDKRILDRMETFDNRSEKWQESKKGEVYLEITDRMQGVLEEVTDCIDRLENVQL